MVINFLLYFLCKYMFKNYCTFKARFPRVLTSDFSCHPLVSIAEFGKTNWVTLHKLALDDLPFFFFFLNLRENYLPVSEIS